jgi:thiol-disulfide isomerase/thioredoxin
MLLLAVCALGQANARTAAPNFTARTLSGQTFTNESVRGSVVLLQFWTTWCPVCRGDQAAVESVNAEFAPQGLVVLAVDVHEPEDTVRQYLEQRPRSCPIVLTQDTDLVAKFKPQGFPLYVVFDREGNIAGTQSGSGGEESLRQLLGRAGLNSGRVDAIEERGDNPEQGGMSGKMIVLPGARRAARVQPARPQVATVLVLSNGERLETHDYVLTSESVRVTVGDHQRTIAMSLVDVKATLAANRDRGIDLKIPSNRHEVFLGH